MDRYWLLTWTTYGTWLPGDKRGFVSPVCDESGNRVIQNKPGTDYLKENPALNHKSRNLLKGKPILLTASQAEVLLEQFHETVAHRGWMSLTISIMPNHVHVVLGVTGDPEPSVILRDLKSYGSRKLNSAFGKPDSGTWWTESGSRRKLPNENAVAAACRYVLNQHNPLLVWVSSELEL